MMRRFPSFESLGQDRRYAIRGLIKIGIAIAGGLYRLFRSQLVEVTALDISSALAMLSLVAAAVLACLVPAIRATRVDPIRALRN